MGKTQSHASSTVQSPGRIVERNPDKSLKSFPPCSSQSPLQLCLEIYISSNSRNLLQFLEFSYCTLQKIKEESLIENHAPLHYGLRNPNRNLKSENSQDYAQKPQQNCTFMNSASVKGTKSKRIATLW